MPLMSSRGAAPRLHLHLHLHIREAMVGHLRHVEESLAKRDAFGHLEAIGVDGGGQQLLKSANLPKEAGVIDIADAMAFIAAAKTRQWDREISVRTLA